MSVFVFHLYLNVPAMAGIRTRSFVLSSRNTAKNNTATSDQQRKKKKKDMASKHDTYEMAAKQVYKALGFAWRQNLVFFKLLSSNTKSFEKRLNYQKGSKKSYCTKVAKIMEAMFPLCLC